MNALHRFQTAAILLGCAMLLALCSSCKNPVGSLDLSGTSAPPRTATVAIRPPGFEPSFVTVQPGGQVTFENRDGVAHQLVSACSQLNTSAIPAGATRAVTMGSAVTTCSYHDHADETKQGTIQVCREIGLFTCR